MKKHLAIIGLLIASGGFVYFGGLSSPSYAANSSNEQAYVAGNEFFRQDTTPRKDTSMHKKMKHKMKKDTTWKKDTLPQ